MKKIAYELKKYELGEENPSANLEKKANQKLAESILIITEKLFANHPNWKDKKDGGVETAVVKALESVASFLEKGGKIEFLKNKEINQDESNVVLFDEIKKLEITSADVTLFLPEIKSDLKK